MNISFVTPFQNAWQRMVRMLFRPFRIETWLVLGFAAFLSEFFAGGAGRNFGHQFRDDEVPHQVHDWVREFIHAPEHVVLLIAVASCALIVLIALQWVSCRGRFVFLDDVARERSAIVEPWRRFARLGNSLFVWTLMFWAVFLLVAVVAVLPFFASLMALWREGQFHWGMLASIFGFIAIAVPIAIVAAYTALFLNHFVVPIMYRQGLSATAAWGRFLSLFRANPGWFIGYGIIMLALWSVVYGLVMVVGFSTCCIGFILLGAPYVGEVFLLPVLATFRGYGPEFLRQFGPDVDAFAAGAGSATPGTPTPGGPATP